MSTVQWPPGARALVESARVARLATADASGAPHVVPICFTLVAERLYSIVDQKPKRRPTALKRLRNIAANPKAAVLVDRWDEDWSQLKWVMLQGSAATVVVQSEYARAVAALKAKYEQYGQVAFTPAEHPLIALTIERVLTWDASRG